MILSELEYDAFVCDISREGREMLYITTEADTGAIWIPLQVTMTLGDRATWYVLVIVVVAGIVIATGHGVTDLK